MTRIPKNTIQPLFQQPRRLCLPDVPPCSEKKMTFDISSRSDGKFSFGEKVKGDGWSAGIDSSGKVSRELEVSGPEDLKGFSGKCKLSGKLAGKVCQQF